jgi:P53 DNA-binding domain
MLNVMYVGQTDGRTYGERFAVRVPLDSEQQKIILEFGCQNSCSGINRRTTALLFCLEDEG